jgi:hypothetical protein
MSAGETSGDHSSDLALAKAACAGDREALAQFDAQFVARVPAALGLSSSPIRGLYVGGVLR